MIRIKFCKGYDHALRTATELLFKQYETTRFIGQHTQGERHISRTWVESPISNRFSLLLSGGRGVEDLLEYWRIHHLDAPIWQNTHYYWSDEVIVPHSTSLSNYGRAHDIFFRHASIYPGHIHPIRFSIDAEREATLYTDHLPESSGIYYDPTNIVTGSVATVTTFKTHFHTAIINVNPDGTLAGIPSDPYIPNKEFYAYHDSNIHLDRITITPYALANIPRLIIMVARYNISLWINQLYGNKATTCPTLRLLLSHPNVHIIAGNYQDILRVYSSDYQLRNGLFKIQI